MNNFRDLKNKIVAGLIIRSLFVFVISVANVNAIDKIPEEFLGSDENSNLEISYDDLTAILRLSVFDTGRSLREIAPRTRAKIGSRMKANRSVFTALEGNRFNYENFKIPENLAILTKIRKSLESVPNEVQLKMLSNNEQLAYWLNLYNITIIEQVSLNYPKSKLDDFLYDDDDGLLDKKILKVAGYELSLNDIQFNIVYQKFAYPQVMYGFYQSVIGGPNIRAEAFTSKNIYYQLEGNAEEFVNSNRGTFEGKGNRLRISTLYERSQHLFPNYKEDLKKHLLYYVDSQYSSIVENSESFQADVENMNISDMTGGYREVGGSSNSNSAALQDSINGESPAAFRAAGVLGVGAINIGVIAESYMDKNVPYGRFPPDVVKMLKLMDRNGKTREGTVQVKEDK